jgi:hypothetical protein
MISFDELWVSRHRERLQRQYGAGTVVAVYEGAVIDWGDDEDAVRERAERILGERVLVARVPAEAGPGFASDHDDEPVLHREALEPNHHRRRFPISFDLFKKIGDLDITGRRTELVDGIVVIDGTERRFAEHDYRLMLESGLVSRDTELVAGIIFWKAAARESAAALSKDDASSRRDAAGS